MPENFANVLPNLLRGVRHSWPRFFTGSVYAVLAALLLTMSSGCAFGDRKMALTYEPALDASVKGSGRAAVVKFDDVRQDKVNVGEVRNGWGLKTASVVVQDQDAGAWMANALAAELERAGVSVTKCEQAASAKEPAVITGSLAELYTSSAFSNRCKVRGKIVVTKAGVPVLNKEYGGEASKANWVAATGEYEGVARAALQNMLKTAVPEILEAMK